MMLVIVRTAVIRIRRVGLVLAGVALGASVSSQAAVFDFSYTFGDTVIAAGSFSGTSDGTAVAGLSDITLAINGSTILTPVFDSHWDSGSLTWISGGGRVGFDINENNFRFSDVDFPSSPNPTAFFYIVKDASFTEASARAFLTDTADSSDESARAGRWSLTERTVAVPDAGATVGMLGLVLVGVWVGSRMMQKGRS